MTDERKMELAKKVYNTLCDAIQNRNWNFEKDEENLVVHFGVNGEDIPIKLILVVDADRQLIRLLSPLPFKMSEEKRMEGALAICAAVYGMVDGSFDYDITDGSVTFRMTASFRESVIGEGLLNYMIDCACATVDKYNDQFLAINKGMLDVTDFIAKES